jgi:hypothetical protein
MPKNFSVAKRIEWKGVRLNEPRVLARVLIGALLAANLVAAVIAFKPFGGSADDLRRQERQKSGQLQQMQARLDASKGLVAKMETARTEGDKFIAKYIMDARSLSLNTYEEMYRTATDAGVKPLPGTYKVEPIEGSETIKMVSITQGFEGTYVNLAKLVNLLEKSPQFLILDTMALNAPQQNGPQAGPQLVNVNLTVIAFERDLSGATP